MLFISEAFAQGAAPPEPDLAANMFPLIIMLVIFYFLLIRPQQKRLKEHNELIDALQKGDEVVTGGGVFGKIKKVDDDILHVEIASGVDVRVKRHTVTETVSKTKKSKNKKDK